ncbi:choline dehydrogenase [Hypoxylon trugodes]|uniref:choline dehydrogenase n=1 Tax=Hypoxylon trugodes TaxID=326681 RepID=UPI00219E0031|nr:choline dehydrogenase [Hypoxylon trugodes]KAI1385485.1 choline dehydrogenase [Hypoxylon trugodes]
MEATYDFVIVGGGTAGLVLAARLSENPNISVAVVEAGSYYQITNPLISSVPLGAVGFTGSSPKDVNPGVDWGFVTAPQSAANNRVVHYPRGKCLGGSSGRNLMMYHRPDEGSLQQWADIVGDESYNFKSMLPYYQKSCRFTAPDPKLNPDANVRYKLDAFVPTGGPLHISYPNNVRPFSTYLGSAFDEIGIPHAEDFNSGTLVGSQFCTLTVDPTSATRSSSQTAFLDACQARPNIKVFRQTLAKKIIFDDNKRATGIQAEGLLIKARKEVILSAGAFQSPQLLMVSGIGPAATLNEHGIPVIVDRPGVGQNMTDHLMFGPSYRVAVPTVPSVLADSEKAIPALFNFFNFAQGPLTNNGSDYIAFEKIPIDLLSKEASDILSKLPSSWPDTEYFAVDGYFGDFANPFMRGASNGYPTDAYDYASIIIAPTAPRSRGSVTIKSADVNDLPIINPNWLTDPVDIEVAVAAFKRVRAVFATKAMKDVLADPVEYFPGPAVKTDEQILDIIRKTVTTEFHASTTCRMGKTDDSTAVVDSKARVIGVSGLRVVDASSFALLPPGHPQSTVYAFAEKIADDIKFGR